MNSDGVGLANKCWKLKINKHNTLTKLVACACPWQYEYIKNNAPILKLQHQHTKTDHMDNNELGLTGYSKTIVNVALQCNC